MRSEKNVITYLDGIPVYKEDPDYARWCFLPDDEELDSILGPGGAATCRETDILFGRERFSLPGR